MAYTKYSLTPADNNAAPPNGAPEGMLPSAVNDTMRDMMSQIRDVGDGIRGGTYTMTAPVITGGSVTGATINNTAIGGTTATTGAFTTVTANKVEDSQGGVLSPISSVMRNRIINGAMVIDQRNAGAEVNPAVSGSYYLDRWVTNATVASKFKIGQNAGSVTPPAGFSNYLGITSLSAYTVGAAETFTLQQRMEGFNTADLGFGTANAKTVTLSFIVYSSLTGTFGGSLRNAAGNRSYPFSYSIPVANTWTQISITIAGDTTGTWVGSTNGIGLNVFFGLGVGSTFSSTAGAWAAGNFLSATGAVSVVGTSGATFYITGVQLEKGTQATSFEYRQYQQELALCQRYFQKVTAFMGVGQAATNVSSSLCFPFEMRASPTFSLSAAAKFSDFTAADFTQSSATVSISAGTRVTPQGAFLNFGNFTGLTTNRPMGMVPNESGVLLLSSEL
jgi:hypothetical protein